MGHPNVYPSVFLHISFPYINSPLAISKVITLTITFSKFEFNFLLGFFHESSHTVPSIPVDFQYFCILVLYSSNTMHYIPVRCSSNYFFTDACFIFPIFILPVSLLLLSIFLLFHSIIPVLIILVSVPFSAFLLSVSRISVFMQRV